MQFYEAISFSRYLLIAGILLDIFVFITMLYHTFIRRSIMLKHIGKRKIASILVLTLLLLSIIFSMLIFNNDKLSLYFGVGLFSFAAVMTISYLWNYSQLSGIQDRMMELLECLEGIIEAGDQNLDGHSMHVKALSQLIYEFLPFDKKIELNPYNLQYAALLLDIGKLGIPREIIDKDGKLTQEEWALIRRHPEIGTKILETIPSFELIRTWIKYHHERVDGKGYYKLKGEEIPFASRILAVADTYSALTMNRSYKAALPYESAISELKLVSGSQLDTEIVELFCSIPISRIEACKQETQSRMERYELEHFR
ncbi:MAG: HD domain-containing protein [Treponema sp.]|nr:HD domain-containing protein [Treponema sp.]